MWTPDVTALALANVVNDSLPRDVRLKQEHFENGTKWGRWSGGDEARYWVERGWPTSCVKAGGFLPTPDNALSKRLPSEERGLLEPALFAVDSTRRVTAEVLANAKAAKSHADLCDALANSSALSKRLEPALIASLPAFSRFSDAAMHAMRGLWVQINHDEAGRAPTVEKLVRSTELQLRFDLLRETSAAWLSAPGRSVFPHDHVVTRLAGAMREAARPLDQLRSLSRHHHEHGGGRQWFREQAGRLVPLVADTGIVASDYRFRLRPLCQLAAQCGVANMNVALDAVTRPEIDFDAGHEPENDEVDAL
jgi:hypothetical protein